MLALVDGVPRLLNLAAGTERVRRAPDRSHHAGAASTGCARRATAPHVVEGLLRGARHDRRDHHADPRLRVGRRGAHRARWSHRSSSARSRPATSSTCSSAASPRSSARSCATSSKSCATTIAELEAILADEQKLRSVIKDELSAVRDKYGDDRRTQITTDPGDLADLDLIEDEELVVVLSHRGYVKTVPVDQFRTQGRGGQRCARRQPPRRGLRRAPAHEHRALVPVVLLEPRPRLPAARARDPDEGPHRARYRAREPHRVAARRAHRSRHRHAHLRRRRVPLLRDPQRHGEEDAHVGVRLVAAQRPDRHQPQRRRRARAGHPDERQRRRVHGLAAGHDDPLLGERRAADGPGDRRRARHEAQEHQRRCRQQSTWPATTPCCCSCHRAVMGSGRRSPRSTARAGADRASAACGSPRPGARWSPRSPSRRATRSCCSRPPATWCAPPPTRSPSRDGTRPGYASLASARAIPLLPWHACSKPRTATATPANPATT